MKNKIICGGYKQTKRCRKYLNKTMYFKPNILVVLNPFNYAAEVTQFYASDLQYKSQVPKWLQTHYLLHRKFSRFSS